MKILNKKSSMKLKKLNEQTWTDQSIVVSHNKLIPFAKYLAFKPGVSSVATEEFARRYLLDQGYETVINLNKCKRNFRFADLYAVKGEKKYFYSVKASLSSIYDRANNSMTITPGYSDRTMSNFVMDVFECEKSIGNISNTDKVHIGIIYIDLVAPNLKLTTRKSKDAREVGRTLVHFPFIELPRSGKNTTEEQRRERAEFFRKSALPYFGGEQSLHVLIRAYEKEIGSLQGEESYKKDLFARTLHDLQLKGNSLSTWQKLKAKFGEPAHMNLFPLGIETKDSQTFEKRKEKSGRLQSVHKELVDNSFYSQIMSVYRRLKYDDFVNFIKILVNYLENLNGASEDEREKIIQKLSEGKRLKNGCIPARRRIASGGKVGSYADPRTGGKQAYTALKKAKPPGSKGGWTKKKCICCHKCPNDRSAPNGYVCTNPSHLYWGTKADNTYDQNRGNGWAAKNKNETQGDVKGEKAFAYELMVSDAILREMIRDLFQKHTSNEDV